MKFEFVEKIVKYIVYHLTIFNTISSKFSMSRLYLQDKNCFFWKRKPKVKTLKKMHWIVFIEVTFDRLAFSIILWSETLHTAASPNAPALFITVIYLINKKEPNISSKAAKTSWLFSEKCRNFPENNDYGVPSQISYHNFKV